VTETQWLSDEEQAAWRALLGTWQLLAAELDRQLQRDAGMPHAYYGILVALSEHPEKRVRMSELAARLSYSQSRLSHAVAQMEKAGWVRRDPCPEDRRSTYAVLTDTGQAVTECAAPGHVRAVREFLFDQLTDAQVHQLREIFEATRDTLLKAAHCPVASSGQSASGSDPTTAVDGPAA